MQKKFNNELTIPVPASLEFAASLDQSSGDLAVPGCSGLKLAIWKLSSFLLLCRQY